MELSNHLFSMFTIEDIIYIHTYIYTFSIILQAFWSISFAHFMRYTSTIIYHMRYLQVEVKVFLLIFLGILITKYVTSQILNNHFPHMSPNKFCNESLESFFWLIIF